MTKVYTDDRRIVVQTDSDAIAEFLDSIKNKVNDREKADVLSWWTFDSEEYGFEHGQSWVLDFGS